MHDLLLFFEKYWDFHNIFFKIVTGGFNLHSQVTISLKHFRLSQASISHRRKFAFWCLDFHQAGKGTFLCTQAARVFRHPAAPLPKISPRIEPREWMESHGWLPRKFSKEETATPCVQCGRFNVVRYETRSRWMCSLVLWRRQIWTIFTFFLLRILIDVVLRNLTAARFKLDLRPEWQVLEIWITYFQLTRYRKDLQTLCLHVYNWINDINRSFPVLLRGTY